MKKLSECNSLEELKQVLTDALTSEDYQIVNVGLMSSGLNNEEMQEDLEDAVSGVDDE